MAQDWNEARSGRTTPSILSFAAAVLLLTFAGAARSQIRINSNLVVVPVSVRGSDGELVTALTKDDFIVLEDGQLQTITNFDSDPQPMSAAIVVDDGIGGIAIHRVASQLSILAKSISPDDEVSVFRYDAVVDQLSDFSKDPKVLQKSIATIAKIAETRPEEQAEVVTGGPGWLRSILGIFPDGSKGTAKNHVLHNAIFDAAMALHDRSVERRRIIFIISDGRASGPANTHSQGPNTDLLLQNDIQVFAVSTDYAKFGSYGALSSYAIATGGDVYGGPTDNTLEHAFSQVVEQARHQYVLGYTSNIRNGKTGTFHAIVVKTNHADQKVTHRKGYLR
jgi:VWFA-related protein